MPTSHVYRIRTSFEKTRPELPGDKRVPGWWELPKPAITIRRKDATTWDYYAFSGTDGVMSARAAELLLPHAGQCIRAEPMTLNGEPYFLLWNNGTIDCLDGTRSEFEMFDHDPSRVMRVLKYAFHKDRLSDPCLFHIPEDAGLFGTDGIERIIRENKLKGIEAVDAEKLVPVNLGDLVSCAPPAKKKSPRKKKAE